MSAAGHITISCDYIDDSDNPCPTEITVEVGDESDSFAEGRRLARHEHGWQTLMFNSDGEPRWNSPDEDLCPKHKAMQDEENEQDDD